MNAAFLDLLANHAASTITHIALFNNGVELASAGYARQPVTWTAPSGDGLIRPNADLAFSMTSGDVVDEWRGFTALTAGTDYGGAALTEATFSNDGTYTLNAATTGIDINVG